MSEDFYIDEKWLAAYFEKDWFDKVISDSSAKDFKFEYPGYGPIELYSDYHEKMVEFLNKELTKLSVKPHRLLEIGSSLGRSYYELCKSLSSIRSATLVEPSQNLVSLFSKIFIKGGLNTFPVLTGNREMAYIDFNTDAQKNSCSQVDLTLLNSTFDQVQVRPDYFDLVISSNVIDQCHEPLALVELLKTATAPDGILVLSCTYQWNEKYIENQAPEIKNINHLFQNGWKLLNETNIPFKVRRHERFWMHFLSHVSIFQKM